MKRAIHIRAGDDVVSRFWRRHLCYLQRAGTTSKIKRQMRRRERRDAKTQTMEE